MKQVILDRLNEIEKTYQVKIIYACESGSRAWGFESVNSDYDVRFIYQHNKDWYLNVFKNRDVIEEPIIDDLDITGWDIKKTIQLAYKSNPSLLEWLSSPIVYFKRNVEYQLLANLVKESYSQYALYYHYVNMGFINYRSIRNDCNIKLKKYLYVLRPLLCAKWVLEFNSVPPILFDDLIKVYLNRTDLRSEVDYILSVKKSGFELDEIPSLPLLNEYLEIEYNQLKSIQLERIEKKEIVFYNTQFKQFLNSN